MNKNNGGYDYECDLDIDAVMDSDGDLIFFSSETICSFLERNRTVRTDCYQNCYLMLLLKKNIFIDHFRLEPLQDAST